MTLQDKIEQGFKEAFVSRGKRKGMLKAQCPKMGTYGSAVWQGVMIHANPYKVGFGHLMFMSAECKEVYRFVEASLKDKCVSHLDRDAKVLVTLGLM